MDADGVLGLSAAYKNGRQYPVVRSNVKLCFLSLNPKVTKAIHCQPQWSRTRPKAISYEWKV